MEITLLTENELKVSLTPDDMEHYSLDCSSMDYDTTGTRRAFWSILDEARLKTGFDAAHDRIYIRIYPSRSGGCEMYVTKLPEGRLSDTESGADPDPETEGVVPLSVRTAERENGYTLYLLDIPDALTLVSLCEKLCACGISDDNAVYLLRSADGPEGRKKEEYCFAVREMPPRHAVDISPRAVLGEYTRKLLPSVWFSVLTEHGACIAAHNAAARIAALRGGSGLSENRKKTERTTKRHDERRTVE